MVLPCPVLPWQPSKQPIRMACRRASTSSLAPSSRREASTGISCRCRRIHSDPATVTAMASSGNPSSIASATRTHRRTRMTSRPSPIGTGQRTQHADKANRADAMADSNAGHRQLQFTPTTHHEAMSTHCQNRRPGPCTASGAPIVHQLADGLGAKLTLRNRERGGLEATGRAAVQGATDFNLPLCPLERQPDRKRALTPFLKMAAAGPLVAFLPPQRNLAMNTRKPQKHLLLAVAFVALWLRRLPLPPMATRARSKA